MKDPLIVVCSRLGFAAYGIFVIGAFMRGFFNESVVPLGWFVYLASIALSAQEKIPIINRAEHFAAFVLLTYIVWVFFLKYLPQDVWRDHPYYTAIIVFSVVAAFGVMNEIVELILDLIFKTK